MPRRKRSRWPPIPRRKHRTGSLSRDQATGEIRARLPKALSPTRTSRLFAPDELAAAAAWLDGEVSRLRTGARHDAATTFEAWGTYWLETSVVPFRSPGTVKAYLLALRRAGPLLELSLGEIRASDVRARLGVLARSLSASTVQGTASVWRQAFASAIEDELIGRNPVGTLRTDGERTRGQERRGWTAKEVRMLWAAIRGHRHEGGFALIVGCGLRLGEAQGLAWVDVDLEGRRAWLHQQWTLARHRPHLKGRNPHWIPLPEPVVAALIRHRNRQAPGATLLWERGTSGRPWGTTQIHADWREVCTAAGVPHRPPHSARHSTASLLRAAGIPIEAVADLLGHAGTATSEGYVHSDAESIARAVRLVAELLGGEAE